MWPSFLCLAFSIPPSIITTPLGRIARHLIVGLAQGVGAGGFQCWARDALLGAPSACHLFARSIQLSNAVRGRPSLAALLLLDEEPRLPSLYEEFCSRVTLAAIRRGLLPS